MPTCSLLLGDALSQLRALPSESVHLVVTDPPYFIQGMGDDWDSSKIKKSQVKAGVVGGMPVGMAFNTAQAKNFGIFMSPIAGECFRLLKPGGFLISFSQARLYHRLGCAIEDAGFEIRDMLAWLYQGQAKAFSLNHFVQKSALSPLEKVQLTQDLLNRKTPQLKPGIEPMVLAQKPKAGTFLQNWQLHKTGLIDASASLDEKFPSNTMNVKKPTKKEKGLLNDHPTVKPVMLIEHLIKLFSTPDQVVLDPFMGSGSHGVAALKANRSFIGIERDPHYYSIAVHRTSPLQTPTAP